MAAKPTNSPRPRFSSSPQEKQKQNKIRMNKKFRIWDKLAKTFIFPDKGYQGHYYIDLNGRFHNFYDGSGGDECVVQQWTGLHDKTDREIYEGDVLKWNVGENFSEVVFLYGSFHVKGINWGAFWYLSDYNDNYEIVGNIFESPELLKTA